MQEIAYSIVSCFKNVDAFAIYNVETLLITGDLLSSYYILEYRTLLALILKQEILGAQESKNLDIKLVFGIQILKTKYHTENLDTAAYIFKKCLTKRRISARCRNNYALKFNFKQTSFTDDGGSKQIVLECSNKQSTRIYNDHLYVLLTNNTRLDHFSRVFKTEFNEMDTLRNIGRLMLWKNIIFTDIWFCRVS